MQLFIDALSETAKNAAMCVPWVREWRLRRPRTGARHSGDPAELDRCAFNGLDMLQKLGISVENRSIVEFGPGDVISYLAGGGGGYGDPFTRDPERVRDDVIDGYVSRHAAEKEYGVVLTDALEIDWEHTRRLRAPPRSAFAEPSIRRPPPKGVARRKTTS